VTTERPTSYFKETKKRPLMAKKNRTMTRTKVAKMKKTMKNNVVICRPDP
jgi:hypothetical protein